MEQYSSVSDFAENGNVRAVCKTAAAGGKYRAPSLKEKPGSFPPIPFVPIASTENSRPIRFSAVKKKKKASAFPAAFITVSKLT